MKYDIDIEGAKTR